MSAPLVQHEAPPPCTADVADPPPVSSHQSDGLRPRLDAPVRSLEMLDLQVAAGADEVYLGMAADELAALTFNAYAVRRSEQPAQVTSQRLLRSLVAEAHRHGLSVNFCADAPHLPHALHEAYLRHVKEAIGCGVDMIFIANVGLGAVLRDAGIDLPLAAGGTMGVTTYAYASWLSTRLGVGRVVLPHQVALGEVVAMCAIPELEIEVQVQTGAGLGCGRCTLWDDPKGGGVGLGCRAGYEVTTPEGKGLVDSAFLDTATDCALCDLPSLAAAGVHALQIPGRESPNPRVNAKITQMYRRMLDKTSSGVPVARVIEQIDAVELLWQMSWVPRLCEQQRCRFRDTPTQRYSI